MWIVSCQWWTLGRHIASVPLVCKWLRASLCFGVTFQIRYTRWVTTNPCVARELPRMQIRMGQNGMGHSRCWSSMMMYDEVVWWPSPTSHLIVILNVLSWIKYLQKFSMQSHYVSYLFYIQRLVLLATKGGTTGSNKVLPTPLFNNITHGNPNMPYPILWFSLEYNLWFASETEEVFFSKGLFRSLLIVGKPLVCD